MNGKNIIVENIKTSQRPKYVWKIDVSVFNVLSGRYAIPKRNETGDIKEGNYQNKPFLKGTFYTLKNNIVVGDVNEN